MDRLCLDEYDFFLIDGDSMVLKLMTTTLIALR